MKGLVAEHEQRTGLLLAAGAFSLWGLTPIYFKALEEVSPLEVLAHRVIWSAILLVIFLIVRKRLGALLELLRSPRLIGSLALSSLLIATNWLCFIWGVTNDRILESSLGYYINPLISVLLGYVFLGERLTRYQTLAVCIALVAVCIQVVLLGKLPWVAMVLALSFGFYGLVRKKIAVDATAGLALETLLLTPVFVVYFLFLMGSDLHVFRLSTPKISALLALAGLITTVPLVLFNKAAHKLRLSLLGIMQYLAPTITLVVGVTLYGESLGVVQMLTFGLIWFALAIFTVDSLIRGAR